MKYGGTCKTESALLVRTVKPFVGVPLILAISLILRSIAHAHHYRADGMASCSESCKTLESITSVPLLTSPADPCTSAANESTQQVSNGKRQGRHHHALF